MSFLDQLFDAAKSAAPTVIGGVATTLTGGNILVGGAVGSLVKKLVGKEGDTTPVTDTEAQQVLQDPNLYYQFKLGMQELEVKKLQEDTKQLVAVNETMRAEAVSGSKAQRGWRPFNGYLFGITLFLDYIGSQIVLAFLQIWKASYTWQHVPEGVYYLWLALLGVTSASRGVEKVMKEKTLNGSLGVGGLAKTFLTGAVGK
jgi:hypothetical protein